MKKIKYFSSLLLFVFFAINSLLAQTVDTVGVYSPSMKKQIKNVVILPAGYGKDVQQKYPVLYLLHGHGNRYDSWIKLIKPQLPQIASETGIIMVCPDGESSWYWDSPINPQSRFETYVSSELTGYMDKNYNTIPTRQGRAVTGYSMGGHGGLWLGLQHPDIFGACGSMSGGVDIRPFPGSWNMKDQLGDYSKNTKCWDEHTVINSIPYNLAYGPLAIIIDCGTEDFFYPVNQKLHEKLLENHIPHDYIIRPGQHTQTYWRNAIDYQVLFFTRFFYK